MGPGGNDTGVPFPDVPLFLSRRDPEALEKGIYYRKFVLPGPDPGTRGRPGILTKGQEIDIPAT